MAEKYSMAITRRALGAKENLGEAKYDFSDWTVFEKNDFFSVIKFASKTKDGFKFNFDTDQITYEEENIQMIFAQLYTKQIEKKVNFFLALKQEEFSFCIIKLDTDKIKKLPKIQNEKSGSKKGFRVIEEKNKYYISLYPYPEKYNKLEISMDCVQPVELTEKELSEYSKKYKKENHPKNDWNRLLKRSYEKKVKYAECKKDIDEFTLEFEKECSFEDFKIKFFQKPSKRKCAYCGIAEDELYKLTTKRVGRGKRLEYDRVKDEDYTLDNIELACYWCNNAKTDTFTVKEFIEIARGINAVWKSRGIEVVFPENSDIWDK